MQPRPPLGVVLLNMGGPASQEAVGPFLRALFADRELMDLPAQGLLGPLIAWLRTRSVRRSYAQIGGGSPILDHSRAQADAMAAELADRLGREVRSYVAFRYTPPRIDETLQRLVADGVRELIVFSQYPQYSGSTSGSSLSDLQRGLRALPGHDLERIEIIDRWSTHPAYIAAQAAMLEQGLARFAPAVRDEVVVVFSAHSLPLRVVERGDPYPGQIEATVEAIVAHSRLRQRSMLAWQSAVGPLRWLEPSTEDTLRQLGAAGARHVLVVPVGFTCDHIETLYELDILAAEVAREAGIHHFERAPSLNDAPVFVEALASIVAERCVASSPDPRATEARA